MPSNPNSSYGSGNNDYGWNDAGNAGPRPKHDLSYNLAQNAWILSLCALVSSFFGVIFVPVCLASISLILSVLSKSSDSHLLPVAKRAAIFSAIAITINAVIVGSSIAALHNLADDPQLYAQLNTLTENYTGESIAQIAGDLDEELGTDLSGFLGIDSSEEDSDDNAEKDSTFPDESTPGGSFPEVQSPDVTNLTFVTREVFHAAG